MEKTCAWHVPRQKTYTDILGVALYVWQPNNALAQDAVWLMGLSSTEVFANQVIDGNAWLRRPTAPSARDAAL